MLKRFYFFTFLYAIELIFYNIEMKKFLNSSNLFVTVCISSNFLFHKTYDKKTIVANEEKPNCLPNVPSLVSD